MGARHGPANIFDKCKGIYLCYEDERNNALIDKWNVEIVKLSRSNRHFDAVKGHLIWESIDKHMMVKFPSFFKSSV